jgi:DNA-binding MarR family transcriptional regulator
MRPVLPAFLALLGLSLAVVLLSAPARAPEVEIGGEDRLQLVATIEVPGDVVRTGQSLPFRVRIVDHNGLAVEGVEVSAHAEGAVVTPAAAYTDVNGLVRFSFTPQVTEVTEFTVYIATNLEGAIQDREEFVVIALPPAPRPILTRPETVSAGIGLAALLAALASTEFGKYGLSNLLLFPLYTRLRKEEVLDHFVRGQIYGYIAAHPGEHYNSLKDALKVTNGTLAHHLRTLEMQGFVKADRDGIYKRFYPVEMQIPRDKGIRLSDLQHHILTLIRDDGGPTQQEIAGRLDVSQQTVSYNLRHLGREGLVRMEKVGRATRYFPSET